MLKLLSNIRQLAFLKRLNTKFVGLALLFVLSQTAGLVHAVVHPFHSPHGHHHHHHDDEHAGHHDHDHGHSMHAEHGYFHDVSCDLFDHLAKPVDRAVGQTFGIASIEPELPTSIQLRSVFDNRYQSLFFSRAPPIT